MQFLRNQRAIAKTTPKNNVMKGSAPSCVYHLFSLTFTQGGGGDW